MTTEQNSRNPNPTEAELSSESADTTNNGATTDSAAHGQSLTATMATNEQEGQISREIQSGTIVKQRYPGSYVAPRAAALVTLVAIAIILFGLISNNFWLTSSGSIIALLISLRVLWPEIENWLNGVSTTERTLFIATVGVLFALAGLLKIFGVYKQLIRWGSQFNWEAVGSLAEWTGAVGQILIAILAVYIAWRQYVISKDLTIQQNRITQQQTIDAYFQGVSDLALDQQGFLEDWPQERAIAEGRTAALLSSVDSEGKAKIIRFLSQSKLLTPIKRDQLLGRPIFNGYGGYEEDREYGVRVIDLGVMLAGADMSYTDLRWTDLSDANLVRANLTKCDLVKANLARTILYDAKLAYADLKATRFFYGKAETATPRSRTELPDFTTGVHTGAVVENADFTGVQRLSEEQRYYCCAWGGTKTRATIPGGCEGIPNKLGR
ncbi:pentapeptide repeat-containing protein [Microseira wollei]|uniref:Pentapeptide repeat-containing protein n=1 Tax=Microseira wollei NIES-4236 TaxID=2530354 RepID=A0AAV3XLU7_9CYAN|nr:pentapeptide repeat-containing protein [Microseira wollei]GET42526.1 pentapeptide repeat-containing protein [Microseira wollei NIES-4236]